MKTKIHSNTLLSGQNRLDQSRLENKTRYVRKQLIEQDI